MLTKAIVCFSEFLCNHLNAAEFGLLIYLLKGVIIPERGHRHYLKELSNYEPETYFKNF